MAASLGVGALAGFGAGAVQIGAPPLLVYWLGGQNSATTVRANIMVYFIMQGALSVLAYLVSGLFTAQTLSLSLLLGVPFGIALAFRRALVPRHQRQELLSPAVLHHHRDFGIDQSAAVRCVAMMCPRAECREG